MILFAVLLAFAHVFILNQIGFWGAAPVLLAVLVYVFRHEARMSEIIASAAVYGFVLSTFTSATDGLGIFIGSMFAALGALLLHRLLGNSRGKHILKGFDTLIIALSFTAIYWMAQWVTFFGQISVPNVILFILWSSIFNLALMVGTDLTYRKFAGR